MAKKLDTKSPCVATTSCEDRRTLGDLAVKKGYLSETDLENIRKQQTVQDCPALTLISQKITPSQLEELQFECRIQNGEKIENPDEIRRHERAKFKNQVSRVQDTFRDAGDHVTQFASAITASVSAIGK
jgi:hypothetical protein